MSSEYEDKTIKVDLEKALIYTLGKIVRELKIKGTIIEKEKNRIQ